MRTRFPEFNSAELEWTNIAGAAGVDVLLLASVVAHHIAATEVLVEVHRKEGALLPRGEVATYVAAHLSEGTIRMADREFKSAVVVALNGVASGWPSSTNGKPSRRRSDDVSGIDPDWPKGLAGRGGNYPNAFSACFGLRSI